MAVQLNYNHRRTTGQSKYYNMELSVRRITTNNSWPRCLIAKTSRLQTTHRSLRALQKSNPTAGGRFAQVSYPLWANSCQLSRFLTGRSQSLFTRRRFQSTLASFLPRLPQGQAMVTKSHVENMWTSSNARLHSARNNCDTLFVIWYL